MKTLIIGLGWLGLPLANHLRANGHQIMGTTRSKAKQSNLLAQQYNVCIFDLFAPPAEQLISDIINDSNVVINIAPGRKTIDLESYQNAIKALLDHLVRCNAGHITFVSTTSVFGNKTGPLDECTKPMPSTNSGKAHAYIEQYLLQLKDTKTSIIRLAGLIGPNLDGSLRHPVYSLIKKSSIDKGHQSVNLLHQADAIALIYAIITKQSDKRIYHGCSSEHPSREAYYSWASKRLGLGTIDFTTDNVGDQGKQIDASQSLTELEVSLKYPSPYDML